MGEVLGHWIAASTLLLIAWGVFLATLSDVVTDAPAMPRAIGYACMLTVAILLVFHMADALAQDYHLVPTPPHGGGWLIRQGVVVGAVCITCSIMKWNIWNWNHHLE